MEEISSDCEGVATCIIRDENGELHELHAKMARAPLNKFHLMDPQWLGMHERDRGVPKENRSKCDIDDEEVVLTFDGRRRKATIQNDPKMLVPVTNKKLGFTFFLINRSSLLINNTR